MDKTQIQITYNGTKLKEVSVRRMMDEGESLFSDYDALLIVEEITGLTPTDWEIKSVMARRDYVFFVFQVRK